VGDATGAAVLVATLAVSAAVGATSVTLGGAAAWLVPQAANRKASAANAGRHPRSFFLLHMAPDYTAFHARVGEY
jgi:predicted phage tail protein